VPQRSRVYEYRNVSLRSSFGKFYSFLIGEEMAESNQTFSGLTSLSALLDDRSRHSSCINLHPPRILNQVSLSSFCIASGVELMTIPLPDVRPL